MIRFLIVKEEPCTECDGAGASQWLELHGKLIRIPCVCKGKGIIRTEIDADEWLAAALVRLGMVTDGK